MRETQQTKKLKTYGGGLGKKRDRDKLLQSDKAEKGMGKEKEKEANEFGEEWSEKS